MNLKTYYLSPILMAFKPVTVFSSIEKYFLYFGSIASALYKDEKKGFPCRSIFLYSSGNSAKKVSSFAKALNVS